MRDVEQVKRHWMTRPVINGEDRIDILLTMIRDRGYIAGSFAAWACSYRVEPWLPTDIDIFAISDEAYKGLTDDLICHPDYFLGSENELVTTFESNIPGVLPIQVVRPSPDWKTLPDDLINSFDLNVCRAVIISKTECICDEDAGDVYGKVLLVNNPLKTFKRIIKYSARGVMFSDHEMLKVFRAWDSTDAERKASMIERAADEAVQGGQVFIEDYEFDEDDYFDAE